jgi:hypothetical protein
MAIPALLCDSEAWTLTARDASRPTEMRFLRAVKGCIRHDRLLNEYIGNELGVQPIQDKLSTYRENWKKQLERMPEERIPKQTVQCQHRRRRTVGRPWKRRNQM